MIPKIESTAEWTIARCILLPQKTKRTGVSYFNHVSEGVQILRALDSSLSAQQAFCLHPLVQHDEELVKNFHLMQHFSPEAVALAFEYRWVANLGVRKTLRLHDWKVQLSNLQAVNEMLVADKVQNRKDFRLHYTPTTHPDYTELDHYFGVWLEALHIDASQYNHLTSLL